MPTIRDVVRGLSQRQGVLAVIVLGRDGLTIDAVSSVQLDTEGLAALVPSIIQTSGSVGEVSGQGEFVGASFEFGNGMMLVFGITPETLLAIFVDANTNVGDLLYELKLHQPAIAGLL
ncbi:MAG: roadblock/LC7 domain-containing protein [Gemmatimonadetes bacterium]|nr:roadblock/LC7 domain-containing protein [Gemmatimonadota bacterium]